MRYEVILRYGIPRAGHEYRFAEVRRENGAISERDNMVAMTVANMREHARDGGRVVVGTLADDPNAVVCALMAPDGTVSYKVVTYRPVVREPLDDGLEDALIASLLALGAGSL